MFQTPSEIDTITPFAYYKSFNRLHLCFIVSYLIISSFPSLIYLNFIIHLYFSLGFLLLILKNHYKLKTIFEMLINRDLYN